MIRQSIHCSALKEINADLGFYNTKNRQDYEFLYLNPDHTEKGPIEFYNNQVPSKINIKALSADITKKFDSELLLEAGAKSSLMENNSSINYQYRDTNGDFITDANTLNYFNYKEHINAAYISLQKKYSQFMLKAGLRIEYSIIEGNSLHEGIIADTDYTRLFPSLTAEYKFNDDHQLNFSYSTSFARPNYTYLSPLTVIRDPNAYSTGNPFLTPSYTNTLELSYTLKKKYRLALQFQDITDRIEQSVFQDYNSLTIENNIVNIDKNYYYRLYFIIPLNITKWWTNNLVLNNYIIQYKTPFLKGIYNNSKPVFYINSTSSFNLPNGIKGELLIYYRTPSLNGLYEVGERFFVDAGLKKTFSNNFSIGMSISDIFHTNKWVWDINYLDQHSGFKTITDSRIFKLNLSYKLGNNKVKTAKSNKSGIGNERQRL